MMTIWRWITGGSVGGSRESSTEYPTPKEKNIMAKKAPNYTDEMVMAITASYEAGTPVEDIAEAIGKSKRSVISKLVREGVYVATEKPKSKRDNGPTKQECSRNSARLCRMCRMGRSQCRRRRWSTLSLRLRNLQAAYWPT